MSVFGQIWDAVTKPAQLVWDGTKWVAGQADDAYGWLTENLGSGNQPYPGAMDYGGPQTFGQGSAPYQVGGFQEGPGYGPGDYGGLFPPGVGGAGGVSPGDATGPYRGQDPSGLDWATKTALVMQGLAAIANAAGGWQQGQWQQDNYEYEQERRERAARALGPHVQRYLDKQEEGY